MKIYEVTLYSCSLGDDNPFNEFLKQRGITHEVISEDDDCDEVLFKSKKKEDLVEMITRFFFSNDEDEDKKLIDSIQ